MNALDSLPAARRCWVLFYEFVRISTFVIGGGFVIIPASLDIFCRKRRWITEEESLDLIAMTQSVPGVLACNAAIFIGFRVAGFRGALSALWGAVLPPLVIITLLASGLAGLDRDNAVLRGMFTGVIAGITGMVLALVIRNGRKTLLSPFAWLVGLGCFCGVALLRLSPGWLILLAVAAGIFDMVRVARHGRI